MTGVEYALLGLLGGFLVETVEMRRAIGQTKTWPWRDPDEPSFGPWLAAILLRLATGAGLAYAAGIGGQVNGPFGALAVGIAAPLLVEKLASQLPASAPTAIVADPSASPSTDEPASSAQPAQPAHPLARTEGQQ